MAWLLSLSALVVSLGCLAAVASSTERLPEKVTETPPTVIQVGTYVNPRQVPALEAMVETWSNALNNSYDDRGWRKPWACKNITGVVCDSQGNVIYIVLPGQLTESCLLPGMPVDSTGTPINCALQVILDNSIPKAIRLLTTLKTLDLTANQINGTLPEELFSLTTLTGLYLGSNTFNTSIPRDISKLVNLRALELGYVFATMQRQPAPVGVAALTKLTSLNLAFSNIHGPLPPSYGNLQQLKSLELGQNSMNGSIPASYSSMLQLTNLQLQQNSLTGIIPQFIGTFTKLKDLRLSKNNLSGPVPENIGNLKLLYFLDFSYNGLTGALPASLAQLTNFPPPDPNSGIGNGNILFTNTSTTCPQNSKSNCLGPPAVNTTSQFCALVCLEFCTACYKKVYNESNAPGTSAGDQPVAQILNPPPPPPAAPTVADPSNSNVKPQPPASPVTSPTSPPPGNAWATAPSHFVGVLCVLIAVLF